MLKMKLFELNLIQNNGYSFAEIQKRMFDDP